MVAKFNKVHQKFKLNGIHYTHDNLAYVAYNLIKEGQLFETSIGHFLLDWLDSKPHIYAKTSGSTGQPKVIKLMKQAMVNSAIATGVFFELQPGNTALHCLPSQYIAGKMMLVRALVLGLELDIVQPSTRPVFNTKIRYDFSAMIPLQLKHTLKGFQNIKKIIVGGSKIPADVLNAIKESHIRFYETYGMTETVTHIAIKALQTKSQQGERYFKALPNVRFSKDNRQCLVINAPTIALTSIITNDIVELKSPTRFKFLGRYDTIINSGGVKLVPEEIEAKLQTLIKQRFILSSESDATLGEKLILIIENPSEAIDVILRRVQALKTLNKFEIPKKIYSLNTFVETTTGKIQRRKTTIKALSN